MHKLPSKFLQPVHQLREGGGEELTEAASHRVAHETHGPHTLRQDQSEQKSLKLLK